ncbi:expressed conserved protein [Echinococcus multilocularis]|uniref:Expressed conserved protein n=1 Tax=Echinococcus multilocularis TaxID=6211 RepID=A0A068YG55_ECHMU|nr:expressed conserved protein [Echinococcus multilocularis]
MRAARKLWVILVTIGVFCVLAAIATNLAAVILPHWMEYTKTSADVYANRGLFQNCKGSFGSECLEISSPLHPYQKCLSTSGTCDEGQVVRTGQISRLRIADWALHVTALGLETISSFVCVVYLLAVRYCMSKPNAQSAQSCLAASGYLLWLSAILTTLGIISFEGTSILESITTTIKLKGMTGSLPVNDWELVERNYDLSSHLSWASVALGIAGSWFWIAASFVQPPPHITSPSMLALSTSSTVPLYPLAPKQAPQEQQKQK